MTAPVVKALLGARPIDGVLALNKFLLAQKLTQEIGKYVDQKEVRRLARQVVIQ